MTTNVVMQGYKRLFTQDGGPGPFNPVKYAGMDGQHATLTGATQPGSSVEAVRVRDPQRIGEFKTIAVTRGAPELPTFSVTLHEDGGSIPSALMPSSCSRNFYEVQARCTDPSVFTGLNGYVLIYSNCQQTEGGLGDRVTSEDDAPIVNELSYTAVGGLYPVGVMSFGEVSGTSVTGKVVDATFGNNVRCANCGSPDDGTNLIYLLVDTAASSPYGTGVVKYSVDGGATFSELEVTGLTETEATKAIRVIGTKLVVLTDTAIYFAEIDADTGIPGTFSRTTTGISTGAPNDMYVVHPREIWVVGTAGYIYKSTDITSGLTVVNDGTVSSDALNRVAVYGNTIVAVADGGDVVVSRNGGKTFSVTTSAPSTTDNITAVAITGESSFFVGTNSGKLMYTDNAGKSWRERTFPGSGVASTTVEDVVVVTSEVIHLSLTTGSEGSYSANLLTSWNGGADWVSPGSGRMINVPSFARASRIAVPWSAKTGVLANTMLAVGLADDESDGIALLGIGTYK